MQQGSGVQSVVLVLLPAFDGDLQQLDIEVREVIILPCSPGSLVLGSQVLTMGARAGVSRVGRCEPCVDHTFATDMVAWRVQLSAFLQIT